MSKDISAFEGAVCPIPLSHSEQIMLGHGSGGKMSHDLINRIFMPPFTNPVLMAGDDAGVVQLTNTIRLAVSTDAHVVSPLFFPGGDIGRLAVCGTVNDVAMMGARPLYLTASFILEEGLEIEVLKRVVASMEVAAQEAGVQIIAGDTKIVQKGKADGLYITTSGVGEYESERRIGGAQAQPGDVVILSGTIGDHGIAVLAARGELGFQADIKSDIAPLNLMVAEILKVSETVHVMRDPTRGGLATSLCEIAQQSKVGIILDEDAIPIRPVVSAACEMLGFDPLYIANEGKMIVIASQEDAPAILAVMRTNRYGKEAIVIGEIRPNPASRVLLKTSLGSTRIVDMLAGEILPRIC